MLNKHKSKQLLKFKYLLMLPLLMSMLSYSSCEKKEEVPIDIKKNEKREMIMYKGDGVTIEREEMKIKMESYFDVYAKGAKPSSGKEISYFDLTAEEKLDFQQLRKPPSSTEEEKLNFNNYKIYEMKSGRKAIYEDIDWENSFVNIEKPPIFPGCEDAEDQKKCFSSNLNKYVAQNFNFSLAESLGLEAGKKKIYVQFKIDKKGAIIDVKSRAPHVSLEKEVLRILHSVPIMKPGEKENGDKVIVRYMLPISFNIQ